VGPAPCRTRTDLLAPSVRDPARRRVVDWTLSSVWPLVEALSSELSLQVVHGDLTDDNVVCTAEATLRRPDGVIDFGDLCRSWTVGELAVTVSSMLHHHGMTPRDVLAAVSAFDREQPLRRSEIDALWPLVVVRGAVLVVSGTHQVEIDESNAYAASGLEREWRILEVAAAVPFDVMRAGIRTALGRAIEPAALPPGCGALVVESGALMLHLSSTSAALDRGRWLEPDVEHAIAMDALGAGAPTVTTAFDEFRMTRSVPLSRTAPATAATGVDAWFSGDTELRAPWPGVVSRDGETVTLRGDEHVLTVGGRRPRGRPVRGHGRHRGPDREGPRADAVPDHRPNRPRRLRVRAGSPRVRGAGGVLVVEVGRLRPDRAAVGPRRAALQH
jgi:Phosphotransferase enzyme family